MSTSLSQRLARFAASCVSDGVPKEVATSVRQRVLDIVGVSLAALTLDTSDAVLAHAIEQGGTRQARAIGVRDELPAASAAFVNGVLAHSLDYDDTHLPSILHPSASIVPAALAAAQFSKATEAQTINAIAAGLEICVRLGMAGYDAETGNSLFFDRGQHATSICGAVAGAATVAALLNLGPEGIADAIGIAVSMGSGVIEGNRAGGTVKRLHCGIAAGSAVNAALLAKRGITGPPTSLEGRFGFFQAWLGDRYNADAVIEGLGTDWEVPDIFFKPYPCNHFTHTAIDAVMKMRDAGLKPDDIEAITLGVATPTVRTIGEPVDAKRAPQTGYQGQFSGPYTIAAALMGGSGLGLGLDDFTDALVVQEKRKALMAKVTVKGDAECDAIYPRQFPAVLKVRLRNGSERVERVLVNRGGPERPLSEEELVSKFRDNASRVLSQDRVAQIEDAVRNTGTAGEILAPTAYAKKE